MHRRIGFVLIVVACALASTAASAVEFRYRGTLQDGGKAAQGAYDIELTLYSAAEGGRVLGGPLTMASVPVRDGGFEVRADFGPLAGTVATPWVGVRVRGAGEAQFAALPWRSALTTATASVCPGAWTLVGNAGNPPGSYLGTADAQPLVLKADATPALTLAPVLDSGNVIGINAIAGDPSNLITAGVSNALVGGGLNNLVDTGGNAAAVVGGTVNKAAGIYSAVAGGNNNTTSALSAFVGGGASNVAAGQKSAIAGGSSAQANGQYSFVGGGSSNVADGDASAIAGGAENIVSGPGAFVGGGYGNGASGFQSAVVGGTFSSAEGDYAVVIAGSYSVAGAQSSFAAGSGALVRTPAQAANVFGDFGTFAWSDSSGTGITSSGTNQFLVSATNGVAIDGTPLAANVELTLHGTQTAGAGDNNVDLAMMPRGGNPGYDLVATSGGAFSLYRTNDFVTPRLGLDSSANLTIVGAHAYKASSGSWEASSDARIKDRIAPLASALDTLARLRPVSFHYGPAYRAAHGDFEDRPYLGFIAQEYAQVFPFAVSSSGERVPGAAASEPPVLSLDIQPAFVTAVAATQELAIEAADLRAENQALHEQLAAQQRQIDAQQAQLDATLARVERLERVRER